MIQAAAKDGDVSAELRQKFEATAEDLLHQGAIGFGEMAALHFSFFPQHPFEEVPPDHPLFLLLADIAARHGVPIDLHMEAVTEPFDVPQDMRDKSERNPPQVSENIAAFERLLAHNPKARIVWDHLGMDTTNERTPELMRRLLQAHPNLYIGISPKPRTPGPNWFMQKGRGINPVWRALVMKFPDRFLVGTDTFYQPQQPLRRRTQATALGPKIVQQLPPPVARLVAYQNAETVFGLAPISH